ncbi:PIG-L deacetylase family protein [Nanoarchaeota archaeon]
MAKENIIFICAHSDDHVIGAGGTIKKYSREGKQVLVLILSHGEKSHPWLKTRVTKKMRKDEALEAGDILGCQTKFYHIEEGHFQRDLIKTKLDKELLKIINKRKPSKIFTHSDEDPHPDHRAAYQITLDLVKKITPKPEIYVFSVWNPFTFRKSSLPRLFVNISQTFKTKIKAMACFHSQRFNAIYPLILGTLIRAIKNGIHIEGKFAEKFYKIK